MPGPASVLAFLALCAMTSVAAGQVYKCQDVQGNTVYADAPCAGGGKKLRLQDDPTRGGSGTTVCGQLLDETRRLAAEADRDAKHGRPKNASNVRRRQALLTQYQRRCAGITRSQP
jgi:hypothetical protein